MDDLFELLESLIPEQEAARDYYLRSPFGWPGGKDRSYKNICARLPYRGSYIETCGGSGIVLLNRRPSPLEVFNDRNAGVTAFFRVLKNYQKTEKLKQWLALTIHSREEFIWCRDTWRNCDDDVERAARWYYMVKKSFGGLGRNYARVVRGRSLHPAGIYNTLPFLDAIHARMTEVYVENMDVLQCIADFDNSDAVFYIDPNYYGVSKGIYEDEIPDVRHAKICEAIMDGKGFFAVSGYTNPVYDSFSWDERLTWEVPVSIQAAIGTETNNRIGTNLERGTAQEVLWVRDNAD